MDKIETPPAVRHAWGVLNQSLQAFAPKDTVMAGHANTVAAWLQGVELPPQRTRRDEIEATVTGMVADFLYYDREDESLPVGAIEEAIKANEISAAEIAILFRDALLKALEAEV